MELFLMVAACDWPSPAAIVRRVASVLVVMNALDLAIANHPACRTFPAGVNLAQEMPNMCYEALSACSTAITAFFTGGLLVLAAWVGKWQRDLMTRQAEITNGMLILTHRPKLIARVVILRYPRSTFLAQPPHWFWPNELVGGQLYIANIGGTPARIVEVGCWVYWKKGVWVDESLSRKLARVDAGRPFQTEISDHFAGRWENHLPMERPYEGRDGTVRDYGVIPAGGSKPLPFQSDKPMGDEGPDVLNGTDGWSLWVMGWIEYEDESAPPNRRTTAFCRVWDPGAQRFFPVDDPDYEHAH